MEQGRQRKFFTELARQLTREGYTVTEVDRDGLLPVAWDGQSLCRVFEKGMVRYFPSDVRSRQAEDACVKAAKVSAMVADYMAKMGQAPPLTASGLSGD